MRSFGTDSRCWPTWRTAARRVATPKPATAPGCCSRCRTTSCAAKRRNSGSTFRNPAATQPASSFCLKTTQSARRARQSWFVLSNRRDSGSSAGATSPLTRLLSAMSPGSASRSSASYSSVWAPGRTPQGSSASCSSFGRSLSAKSSTRAFPRQASSTCAACPQSWLSTRACSWAPNSGASTRTWMTRSWRVRSRLCIRASAPTPWGHGSWHTPTATSSTTARLTRCGATSTGWWRARTPWPRRNSATISKNCSPSSGRGRATPRASTTPTSSCSTPGARCTTR